jgi:hypothetical protein
MTNVMHKFLISLSNYFCLTCFGLSFSPSSEAGVQLRHWFKSAGYGVSARALTDNRLQNEYAHYIDLKTGSGRNWLKITPIDGLWNKKHAAHSRSASIAVVVGVPSRWAGLSLSVHSHVIISHCGLIQFN